MKIVGNTVGTTMPKPNLMQDDPSKGDYVKGREEFAEQLGGGGSGEPGKDGVSATHEWNGTVLTITSASGTSSADLKGEKGDKGDTGAQGIQGIQGEKGDTGITGETGAKGETGDNGFSVFTTTEEPTVNDYPFEPAQINAYGRELQRGDLLLTPGGKLFSIYGVSAGVIDARFVALLKGADGKTPVKGVDYWTANDKSEMVEDVLAEVAGDETLIDNIAEVVKAEVPLVKTAEQPDFVNSVEEMTDTSKVYVMPDGYMYGYREIENYNLFKLNEVSYSSRLQDNVEGTVASTGANAVTGWIPVEHGKYYSFTILLNGVRGDYWSDLGGSCPALVRMNLKKADGTVIAYNSGSAEMNALNNAIYKDGAMGIPSADIVAIRIHFQMGRAGTNASASLENLAVFEPMICEGNTAAEAFEKSTTYAYLDGDAEAVAEWYNTGLAYNQPVDYEDRVRKLESDVSELQTDMEELKTNKENPASASPYYRDVNFGVVPFSYYQGVGESYDSIGFNASTTYATFMEAWKALTSEHSAYVTETELGSASDGQKLYMYNFKPVRISNQNKPMPKIIIIAGQHGTEKANVFGWYCFVDNLLNHWHEHSSLDYLRNHVELMIVPVVNTYGFDNYTYKNANDVNINRNYDSNWKLVEDTASSQYGGAEPFDQPESQIVRNLISNNSDALLVIDSHVCDDGNADAFEIMTYYAVSAGTNDIYYERMLEVVAYQLSSISSHFNIDYALNQPDTIMGYLTYNRKNGLLRDWVTDNNIIGVLVEGFTGFPNEDVFIGRVFKANEEIIVNYIITALNYLSK